MTNSVHSYILIVYQLFLLSTFELEIKKGADKHFILVCSTQKLLYTIQTYILHYILTALRL